MSINQSLPRANPQNVAVFIVYNSKRCNCSSRGLQSGIGGMFLQDSNFHVSGYVLSSHKEQGVWKKKKPQVQKRAARYDLYFWMFAAISEWNKQALITFHHGLWEEPQTELPCQIPIAWPEVISGWIICFSKWSDIKVGLETLTPEAKTAQFEAICFTRVIHILEAHQLELRYCLLLRYQISGQQGKGSNLLRVQSFGLSHRTSTRGYITILLSPCLSEGDGSNGGPHCWCSKMGSSDHPPFSTVSSLWRRKEVHGPILTTILSPAIGFSHSWLPPMCGPLLAEWLKSCQERVVIRVETYLLNNKGLCISHKVIWLDSYPGQVSCPVCVSVFCQSTNFSLTCKDGSCPLSALVWRLPSESSASVAMT